jgi:hypothetical protein
MDKVYIKNIVQNILNMEFKSLEKRRIHEYPDRLNYACPICSDSKDVKKKRGNLYFNRLIHVCFNCGAKINFDRLCKRFNQQLDPSKKMEMIQHLESSINYKDYEDSVIETSIDNLLKLDEVSKIFNAGDYAITDFVPIQKGSRVYKYLIGRGIFDSFQKDMYQAKYWYNEDRYEEIVCFLNRRGNHLLGMQIRNLKEGKKRMFKIYNFETLYKWINDVEDIEDIDINQIVMYNKLSYYFNILNVDFSQTVTIFEGYLDSLFYPNSIGVVGTNTDFKFLENNNLEIQYFFDNDSAGYEKSEEKLKDGFPVFLWKKLFDNIVEKKKNEDPYKLMYRISKIKDLNKLSELVQNPYRKLNLNDFFSRDIMDLKYIPKKKKYYKKNLIK